MIAYSGNQRSSAVISVHQRTSGVSRGHQGSSERQAEVLKVLGVIVPILGNPPA